MNSRPSLEQIPGRIRALGTLGLLVVSAGIAPASWAQNAAQRTALGKLGAPHANVPSHNTQVNGVEATGVRLDQPNGVAYDAAGNFYIADTDNFVIREVNLAGITTVVAGTGEQGFGGDGGPATSALLDSPEGIALDAAGNLYIADSGNHRIREVTAGVIATIAGTGTCGYSGDGGPAAAAALCLPTAVAVDSTGGVYIADTNNYRIRKIAGTTISTVAGNGAQSFSGDGGQATAAGLDSPFGVAVDSGFNIYIADTYNQRVRMVAYGTGIIGTIAGTGVKSFTSDGAAATAAFALPTGIAVDSRATVYVADSDNNRIRTIASAQIATIAGTGDEGFSGDTGSPTSAELDAPRAVALFGNSLTVADTENQAVRIVTANGIDTTAGSSSNSAGALAITGVTSTAYGTGTLTATFSNGNRTATGSIAFHDGLGGSSVLLSSTALTANQATLNTNTLSAGMHYLTASYGGDPNDGPLVSGVYVLNVMPAAITAVANGVNLSYGQSVPTLTGSLSGVLPQDAGKVTAVYTTAASGSAAPGSYPISVSLSGASANDYTLSLGTGSGTVTIAKAATQIELVPSAATVAYGATVTLTASVASTATFSSPLSAPTGTVTFMDGANLLGTSTLSGGTASFTTSSLTAGSHSTSAVYSGDANFVSTASSAVSESILDFALSANSASYSGSTPALMPGGSAALSVSITPSTGTAFPAVAVLSVSGLPAGVTATVNGAAWARLSATSWQLAANTQLNDIALSFALPSQTAKTNAPASPHRNRSPVLWGILLLPFAVSLRRSGKRMARMSSLLLILIAGAAAIAGLSGCGSGNGFFAQAPQSHDLTITVTTGALAHSTHIRLNVE
jgi:Bacterial Ig-like domain (group 3)/MBG domain (YGX type)/NHL repeat